MRQIKDLGQIFPIVIKKSKFIASASPINTETDANDFIQKISEDHKRATHNCYAYRIKTQKGIIINESDDGEPSGTGGNSILYVLEKQNIVNTIVVVSRYYGGIKLGKGGLVRAYSKATSEILKAIGTTEVNI